jgi:outer membrane assembly lipoprotein YfgL
VDFPLEVKVNRQSVTVASSDGSIGSIDPLTGRDFWRVSIGGGIAAGVGSDGRYAAVVTTNNELVVIDAGQEIWRQSLAAQGFTAPLVAGGRVFVLTADRAVSAFDVQSGRKLWTQQRPGESLILRQSGVLTAVGETLVAGLSGRLLGIDPLNGSIRWELPIATPRGTNDIERLVDLVAPVSRSGDSLCARAFQSTMGCVNTERASVVWTKPAYGAVGVDGDEQLVFGVEGDGQLLAWQRASGERAWLAEGLRYRHLTAPLLLGRSVVVGDESGTVHFLSREDGTFLTRVTTDSSGVATAPVMAAGTLVVVTRSGGIFGFVPE